MGWKRMLHSPKILPEPEKIPTFPIGKQFMLESALFLGISCSIHYQSQTHRSLQSIYRFYNGISEMGSLIYTWHKSMEQSHE